MKQVASIEIWIDDDPKTPNYPQLGDEAVAKAMWNKIVAALKGLPASLYGVLESSRPDATKVLGPPGGDSSAVKTMLDVQAEFDPEGVGSGSAYAQTRTWKVTWEPDQARYVLPPDV